MLDLHVLLGKQPGQLDEQPTGDDNRALSVDIRVERRPKRELHVGGSEPKRAPFGLEEHTGEDLDRRSRRHRASNDAELLHELVARAGELHPGVDHDVCFHHLFKNLSL